VPYVWDVPYLGLTATGLVGNPFSIGWAVMTAPFFAVAHVLSLVLAKAGIATRLDGYGLIDQFVTNLGAVLYGLAGVYLCHRTLRRFFGDIVSGVAVVTVVLCSNLPYYIVVHASMAHAVAFFCVAWMTLCFVRLLQDEMPTVQFGLAGGLTFLARPQLAPLIAVLFLAALWRHRTAPRLVIEAAIVCAAVAALQLVVWMVLYGTPILVPQGEGFLSPLPAHALEVLFSLDHGLLTWTPFLAVGIAGLALGAAYSQQRLLFAVFILAVASQIYVNGAAADWWSGNSFGYRRMIEVYPMLMFGVAWMLALGRRSFAAVAALAIVCGVFNALFFVQYRFCYIPRGEAITFRQLLVDKLLLYRLDRPYCDKT